MAFAETKMTGEESRGTGDLSLIAPWMACVACWKQMFDLDEDAKGDSPSSGTAG